MKILFMCVANSARSQMAEGLARKILGPNHEVQSAGSHPAQVNPFAVQAMKEVGVDLVTHRSKAIDELSPQFIVQLDYVITLCAEEVCPTMVSKAKKLQWPHPDPAGKGGSDEDQLRRFREVRDAIEIKIREFAKQQGLLDR